MNTGTNATNVNTPVAHSDLGCQLWGFDETSRKYKYLVPVRAIPATGAAPSTIEVTEMDSPNKQYIPDRVDVPAMEFDYNYNSGNYAKCKTFCDGVTPKKFLVTYPDKSGVKFEGTGSTWRDSVSTGGEIKGKISVAITKLDDVADCSTIVDGSSVPSGKLTPFAVTAQTPSNGNQ